MAHLVMMVMMTVRIHAMVIILLGTTLVIVAVIVVARRNSRTVTSSVVVVVRIDRANLFIVRCRDRRMESERIAVLPFGRGTFDDEMVMLDLEIQRLRLVENIVDGEA